MMKKVPGNEFLVMNTQTQFLILFLSRYVTVYTMFPVFLLVIDKDVTPETAIKYPELYKDLQKVRWMLKINTSYGHAIALWKKRCGIDQKRLII